MDADNRAARAELPLLVTALSMVAFGVVLRFQALGFPGGLTFDEHHFVENARNYLAGQADWNDHPPLGKLLIALSVQLGGDTSFMWRLPAAVLGTGTLALGYGVARRAFLSRLAGALAAGFLAIDGFLIAYSKTALLDGTLLFFMLAAVLQLLHARRPLQFAIAGALIGAAASVKFSGIVLLGLLALCALRLPSFTATALALAAAVPPLLCVYAAQYAFALQLTDQDATLGGIIDRTLQLYRHHAGLTDWVHPLVSHWYAWLLPDKPFVLSMHTLPDGRIRMMTTLGNPLLWWTAELGVLVAIGLGLRRAASALSAGLANLRQALDDELLLVAAFFAPIAPWWLSARDSYVYHYLPSYALALIMLAGLVLKLPRRTPYPPLLFAVTVLAVSAAYAPLSSKLPVRPAVMEQRLFLQTWRPGAHG